MMGAFGGIAGYGGGPERSGCGYSSDAAVYGYDHFIVPDVQREHPDWAPELVRQEALIRFNLRYSENIASLHCERKGESSTTVWREEMLDGERTLVIHGGKYDGYTLDRFWHESLQYDQEKGTARSGNIEEYHVQKRIQQAILTGEITSSASIIGHPESVKLIQTFHRGSDGLYYSEQIDLEGLTGRTLTFAEAKAVMAALHNDHKPQAKIADAHHDHFMVTKGEITASEVKTIAQAVVLTSSETQPTHEQRNHPKGEKQAFSALETPIPMAVGDLDRARGDMFVDTSRIIFRDTGEAIKGITVLLHDKEKRKEAVDRIRMIFSRRKKSIDNHNAAALSLSTKQENERLTIEKIREKPVRIVEVIEKRHEKMKKGVTMLGVIAETGVMIHAAPVILARLAEKLPTPVVAMKKSIERHAKNELKKKRNELRKTKRETKKVPVKVQPLKTERVEPLKSTKERKKRRKRKMVYMRETAVGRMYTKRVVVEKRLPRAVERRKLRVIRNAERVLETKQVPKREKRLWVALAIAGAEFARVPRREKRERAVAGISFACVLWMLLTRKDTETPKNNFKRSHPAGRRGETLRRQEETLWVLRAIIYYLTAIREQAMHNHPVAQISPVQQTIPQYAVIFAYAS